MDLDKWLVFCIFFPLQLVCRQNCEMLVKMFWGSLCTGIRLHVAEVGITTAQSPSAVWVLISALPSVSSAAL